LISSSMRGGRPRKCRVPSVYVSFFLSLFRFRKVYSNNVCDQIKGSLGEKNLILESKNSKNKNQSF